MVKLTLREIFDIRDHTVGITFGEPYGAAVAPADKLRDVNRAIRRISRKLFLFSAQEDLHLHTDVDKYNMENSGSNATTNDVGKAMWNPQYVYIKGSILVKADRSTWGFYDWKEFLTVAPHWWDQSLNAPGEPTMATWLNTMTLLLHPAPNQETVDDTDNYIAGFYMADDLSINEALDNTPDDFPVEVHESIGIMAAILKVHSGLGAREQWQVFQTMAASEAELVKEIGTANLHRISHSHSEFGQMFMRQERV